MSGARVVALVLVAAVAAGCTGGADPTPPAATGSRDGCCATSSTSGPAPVVEKPLAGKVVVLDPGHQLGNRHHGSEIARPVDAGGFDKECNTTGAATNAGYPEATFTWKVAVAARRILRRLGARVVLTRASNSDDLWGPCVDVRGSIGNPGEPGRTADLRVSIHADGVAVDGARGFHVIRPGVLDGWTDDIAKPSRKLAVDVRDALEAAGFPASSYQGRNGIDVRTDLGTLNHSDIPTVMVELANMRDPRDAALVESAQGRNRYARALAQAIRKYLAR
ncbi:N-acetylmuramoyl-L-alanine amidase family protein [Nocardioides sp. CPCC 206347]|uniref:N-acetylmuramoyl-L-alanine amidase family protein n=1 Tax=Nocardioides sp. CPCC 206347 TaxID=3406463 RepID=UPI003B43BF85